MDVSEGIREATNLIMAVRVRELENEVKGYTLSPQFLNISKKNNSLGDKMEFNSIPRFEPSRITMEGEKVTVDSVVNKEVAFLDIQVAPSTFYEGDFGTVQIANDLGEKQFFNTSSKVLIAQLTDLKDKAKLPIRATIKKVKRYFTLS